MVPLGLDRFNEAGFFAPDGQREGVAIMLPKAFSIVFALAGVVTDENGDPLPGVDVKLTGSQTVNVLTDSQGKFRFSNLPTSGSYNVTVNKHHYTFGTSSQTFINPATDVNAVFQARVNRHAISGRIVKTNGAGVSGVTVELAQSPEITATTDENGFYSFPELAAGKTSSIRSNSS